MLLRALPALLLLAHPVCAQQAAPGAMRGIATPHTPGGDGSGRPQVWMEGVGLDLGVAAAEKLGSPVKLILDPQTGTLFVFVILPVNGEGGAQLRQDDRGNRQLTPAWVLHMTEFLPPSDRATVLKSIRDGTLERCVTALNPKNNQAKVIRLRHDRPVS